MSETSNQDNFTAFGMFVAGATQIGGACIVFRDDAATTDANLLTRIVVLAHDRAIRATLDSGGPRGLALMLWKRTREGDFCDRHPALEDHAAAIREMVRPCKIYGVDR